MTPNEHFRARNYATALVALYGVPKIQEMAERGKKDPTSLTESEFRAVAALAWLNTHKDTH